MFQDRTENLGGNDRVIRLLLAVALVVFAYYGSVGAWAYALYAVAAGLVLSATFGFCPAYAVFGVRTCRTRTSS